MRVLYVDIDSLRPDHLGCYGYPRDTSPTIDELANEVATVTERWLTAHASEDDWLLIRTYHDGYKEALDGTMLFDLASDPHETVDLSEECPAVVESGVARLQRWIERQSLRATAGDEVRSPKDVIDPLWELLDEGDPFHVRGRHDAYARHLRERGLTTLADRFERDAHRMDP